MALPPILAETLRRYGLQSLTKWAANAIINGWSKEQITLELYKRPEFKKRFPAIFALEAKHKPPLSVDEYLAYEQTAAALAAMWGVKLSKDEVDNLLSNEVSNVELQKRFDLAAQGLYESDPFAISELQRMSGADPGNLIRYFMDPKKELGALQSQFRQAGIAGAALRTGWGQLTQAQAQTLEKAGLEREQATTGFGQLAKMDEIFTPFDIGEEEISADKQVAFLAGDIEAAQEIEARVAKRKAEFAGAGGFATGKEGFATGVAQ